MLLKVRSKAHSMSSLKIQNPRPHPRSLRPKYTFQQNLAMWFTCRLHFERRFSMLQVSMVCLGCGPKIFWLFALFLFHLTSPISFVDNPTNFLYLLFNPSSIREADFLPRKQVSFLTSYNNFYFVEQKINFLWLLLNIFIAYFTEKKINSLFSIWLSCKYMKTFLILWFILSW